MKLNPDCIRAVMLEIETKQKFITNDDGLVEKNILWLGEICDALPQYSQEEVFYSLFNLEQAGYINLSVQWSSGCVYNCAINHMTFAGHEFLNSIRDTKHWTAVKEGLSFVRNFSLSAISAIAEGIANALIGKYIGELNL